MAKKILVVDDEQDARTLIKIVLEDGGYEVTEAKGGKEGLAMLKKKKFNLILIDFFMPGMTGRDLAEAIRKDKKTKTTKFVFLTVATFGKKGHEELKILGSLDYIQKPFDNEDFLKRIKKII